MTFKICRFTFDGAPEAVIGQSFSDFSSCETALESLLIAFLARAPHEIESRKLIVLHTGSRQYAKPFFVIRPAPSKPLEHSPDYGLHIRCDSSDGMSQIDIDGFLVKLADKLHILFESDY